MQPGTKRKNGIAKVRNIVIFDRDGNMKCFLAFTDNNKIIKRPITKIRLVKLT